MLFETSLFVKKLVRHNDNFLSNNLKKASTTLHNKWPLQNFPCLKFSFKIKLK